VRNSVLSYFSSTQSGMFLLRRCVRNWLGICKDELLGRSFGLNFLALFVNMPLSLLLLFCSLELFFEEQKFTFLFIELLYQLRLSFAPAVNLFFK
jgi:hypothetical protein